MTTGHDGGMDIRNGAVPSRRLADRLLWICPVVGLLAGAAVLWIFGMTMWTAAAVVLLIACPLAGVWILAFDRQQNPIARRKP